MDQRDASHGNRPVALPGGTSEVVDDFGAGREHGGGTVDGIEPESLPGARNEIFQQDVGKLDKGAMTELLTGS